MENRSEGPARHGDLKQEKSGENVLAHGVAENIRRNQQRRAGESDQHAEDSRPVQPDSAGEKRFDAGQPERGDRDEQSRQAAGDPQLGEHHGAVSDPEDEDAGHTGDAKIAAARQRGSAPEARAKQDGAGNTEPRGDERERGERLERDANSEVGGSPEKADRGQRQIGFKKEGPAMNPA